MGELDYEESWALKNWCFWTVVLEKTLESPLDCKEIQPVHPKGDQSWVSIGRTDVEAETPILWPHRAKSWLIGKDPDAGRDWGQEEKGMTEDEMAGWHYQLDGLEFGWTPRVGDGQGGLACCNSWGHSWTQLSDWTELNWTEKRRAEGGCVWRKDERSYFRSVDLKYLRNITAQTLRYLRYTDQDCCASSENLLKCFLWLPSFPNDYFIKKNPFLLSYFPDLYFWHGISLLLYGISLFTGFSLLLNYFSLLLVWEYRLCHICVCVCVCVCECIFDLNGLLNVMAASWQQRLFLFLHFDLKLIRHTLPEEEKKLKKESTSAQHTRKPGVSIHLCTWERMDWTAEEVAEQGKWHWIWWQQRSHGREGRAQSVSELVQQFWKRR